MRSPATRSTSNRRQGPLAPRRACRHCPPTRRTIRAAGVLVRRRPAPPGSFTGRRRLATGGYDTCVKRRFAPYPRWRHQRRGVLHAPVLRMLAVAWLVVLSPALCCCGLRSILSGATPGSGPTLNVVVVSASRADAAPRCPNCIEHQAPRSEPGECPSGDGDSQSTCHCHEIGRDTTIPSSSDTWMAAQPALLALLPPPMVIELDTAPAAIADMSRRPPPPRRTTLLELHCMLTT